jgi:hypothetical protein
LKSRCIKSKVVKIRLKVFLQDFIFFSNKLHSLTKNPIYP